MACEQYIHVEGTFLDPGTELFFMANLLSVTNKIWERKPLKKCQCKSP